MSIEKIFDNIFPKNEVRLGINKKGEVYDQENKFIGVVK